MSANPSRDNMADPGDAWDDNIGGAAVIDGRRVAFYVDRQCILCSVCSDTAPQNFRASDAGDHDVCFRQPDGPDELLQCYTALENCPVEAIGDDGH